MKVMVLANFGMGLYKFRKELIEELLKKGNKVILVVPNDEFTDEFEKIDCKVIDIQLDRRGVNPVKDVTLLRQYIKLIKKSKPDVVLTYTIKPNIYGGLACQITKTKYITTITGLGTAIENKGFLRTITLMLYRVALRSASNIFYQNEKNKNVFEKEKISKGKSKVIPGSGVNITQFKYEDYPDNENSIEILYVGRIMRDKGMNELLAAISIIKEKYSNVNFSLIGFCEEEYESKLVLMESEGLLQYHGKQNDVIPFIIKSHAIILPSYHEGLSNVLLEAASIGRPVIASNIAGCRETFDDNISGVSFESKSTESLVYAIEKFVNLSYEERKQMGYRGREKMMNEFDRSIVVANYLDEIERGGH